MAVCGCVALGYYKLSSPDRVKRWYARERESRTLSNNVTRMYDWIMGRARDGCFQHLIRKPFDFSTAHMNDARVSTSSLPLIGGISRKCFSTMPARTTWTSSTSAKMGGRPLFSSSSKRELRRLLCSFDSRRGLLAGVVCAGGLRTRGECR